jgi:NAD-dependent deacetylase
MLLSHSFFTREPETFFRYYKEVLVSRMAKPNAAHIALAELERRGMLSAVVTQNVDGLHQAAGSKNVLELHGGSSRHYCVKCGAKYPLAYVMDEANCKNGIIPVCEKCAGIVRPDVVLYEEALNDDVISSSVLVISSSDLMIIGGTSLAVYPAAGLLRYFKGGAVVLINKSETPADRDADLVIREPIGEVMGRVMEII